MIRNHPTPHALGIHRLTFLGSITTLANDRFNAANTFTKLWGNRGRGTVGARNAISASLHQLRRHRLEDFLANLLMC
jgi:hypothetical protein